MTIEGSSLRCSTICCNMHRIRCPPFTYVCNGPLDINAIFWISNEYMSRTTSTLEKYFHLQTRLHYMHMLTENSCLLVKIKEFSILMVSQYGYWVDWPNTNFLQTTSIWCNNGPRIPALLLITITTNCFY